MKSILTAFTAVIFASAMALPAFAQVGAGVAGNATVGERNNHIGANADIANSDAERAEPDSPTDASPTVIRPHASRSESSTSTEPSRRRGVDANSASDANAGSMGGHVRAGADAGTDNSPTGAY
jgi:hypothetical protein